MSFRLKFTTEAHENLIALEKDAKKLRKVRACLAKLQVNPRHPGLQSHKYDQLKVVGQVVYESYVENNTPAAWRVFWHYGPDEGYITVISITPHP